VEYKTTLSDGSVKHGVLDADGYAKITGVPVGTSAKVQYLKDNSSPTSEVGIKTDTDWSQFQSIKVTAKPVANTSNANDPGLDVTA
jgi:type VI secretion system secreted protein VgrG